jgi:hypothetical protein
MTEGEAIELSKRLRREGPEVLEQAERAMARLNQAVGQMTRTVQSATRLAQAFGFAVQDLEVDAG